MDTVKTNRHKYIGGSDIPTLLGINQYKTKTELINQYVSQEENNITSEYALYGNYMEESIRVYANSLLGYNCSPAYKIIEDKKIRCNTDGYDKNANVIFEIKTNNGKHNNTFDYEVQMQLYMWAFDVDKGFLIQYERPTDFYTGFHHSHIQPEYFDLTFDTSKVKIKEIKRNKEIINVILNEITVFWETVDKLKKGDENEI